MQAALRGGDAVDPDGLREGFAVGRAGRFEDVDLRGGAGPQGVDEAVADRVVPAAVLAEGERDGPDPEPAQFLPPAGGERAALPADRRHRAEPAGVQQAGVEQVLRQHQRAGAVAGLVPQGVVQAVGDDPAGLRAADQPDAHHAVRAGGGVDDGEVHAAAGLVVDRQDEAALPLGAGGAVGVAGQPAAVDGGRGKPAPPQVLFDLGGVGVEAEPEGLHVARLEPVLVEEGVGAGGVVAGGVGQPAGGEGQERLADVPGVGDLARGTLDGGAVSLGGVRLGAGGEDGGAGPAVGRGPVRLRTPAGEGVGGADAGLFFAAFAGPGPEVGGDVDGVGDAAAVGGRGVVGDELRR